MGESAPQHWKIQELDELINIDRGYAFKSKDYRPTGVPIVRVTNLEKDGIIDTTQDIVFLDKLQLQKYEDYILKHKDVLLVMVGATVGKLALVTQEHDGHLLNQNIWRLTVKSKGECSQNFLFHSIQPVVDEFLSRQQGSARTFLTQKGFSRALMSLPPLPEQKKIATILTSVDTVIEKTQAQIDKLNDLKTGMMQELLTKGVGPDGKPHTEFKDSPVGLIPVGWDVASLGDISVLASGGTPDRGTLEYWNGDIPWVKTGEIDYEPIESTEETITTEGLENSSAKLIKNGAILMAMYGQGKTRGKVALLNIDAACNQACLSITPIDRVSTNFLYYCLANNYEYLRSLVQEGAQKNLSASIVKNIQLAVPPVEEQEFIQNLLVALDNKIKLLKNNYCAQLNLKKALMQDLLTGKVRVTPDVEST